MATLCEARLHACQKWPCGAHAILSLTPVDAPGLATLAVDRSGRLYVDAAYLATLPADTAAGVILHEVTHLLLRHFARAPHVLPPTSSQRDWERWNAAADFAVNDLLTGEGISLPAGALLPGEHGLARGLSAERYYRLLVDREQHDGNGPPTQNPDPGEPTDDPPTTAPSATDAAPSAPGPDQSAEAGPGGPSRAADGAGGATPGGQRPVGTGAAAAENGADDGGAAADAQSARHGGSCADGQPRPWELPPPADGGPPGLKPHELDILARSTAQRILDKSRGTGGGSARQWAEGILRPRIDPRRAFLAQVRQAVELAVGTGDYSYRRPSRRRSSADAPLPGNVCPVPRITLLIDTSGSMDQRDLGLALGLVGKVLKSLPNRDGLRVLCGDEQRQTAAQVFDPKRIELRGGGGTDMAVLIGEAAREIPRPQLIVVVTDGLTPWPAAPPAMPVVACLTREASRYYPPPAWLRTVELRQ
jgi:hypothetical protein